MFYRLKYYYATPLRCVSALIDSFFLFLKGYSQLFVDFNKLRFLVEFNAIAKTKPKHPEATGSRILFLRQCSNREKNRFAKPSFTLPILLWPWQVIGAISSHHQKTSDFCRYRRAHFQYQQTRGSCFA